MICAIDMTRALVGLFIMFFFTYLLRMFPLVLFKKKIQSTFVNSFLYYVPYAVIASLTFPEIFTSTGSLDTAICGTAVAMLLAFFKRSLVIVALAAIVTVYLVQFIL